MFKMKKIIMFLFCFFVFLYGCSTPDKELLANPLEGEPSFIAIDRATGLDVHQARSEKLQLRGVVDAVPGSAPEDFYLAIHKRELGNKFFYVGFFKTVLPDKSVWTYDIGDPGGFI